MNKEKKKHLPKYEIVLKNDDKNSMEKVITTIHILFGMDIKTATLKTLEAHSFGQVSLGRTHFELAETLVARLKDLGLEASYEKVE